MNIWIFGLLCAALLIMLIFWAWHVYENDKLPPVVILLVVMNDTAIIASVLTYVAMRTFGG